MADTPTPPTAPSDGHPRGAPFRDSRDVPSVLRLATAGILIAGVATVVAGPVAWVMAGAYLFLKGADDIRTTRGMAARASRSLWSAAQRTYSRGRARFEHGAEAARGGLGRGRESIAVQVDRLLEGLDAASTAAQERLERTAAAVRERGVAARDFTVGQAQAARRVTGHTVDAARINLDALGEAIAVAGELHAEQAQVRLDVISERVQAWRGQRQEARLATATAVRERLTAQVDQDPTKQARVDRLDRYIALQTERIAARRPAEAPARGAAWNPAGLWTPAPLETPSASRDGAPDHSPAVRDGAGNADTVIRWRAGGAQAPAKAAQLATPPRTRTGEPSWRDVAGKPPPTRRGPSAPGM